ncbi:hypothetical protein NMY22_g14527 [Coprinellus aureogranulatus]|nr:hypothetical protein NMY22_g14527 [Coprinellus aureogranulatus]
MSHVHRTAVQFCCPCFPTTTTILLPMDPSRLQKRLQEENEDVQAGIDSGRFQKRTRMTNKEYDVPQSAAQTASSEVIRMAFPSYSNRSGMTERADLKIDQRYHAPVNVVGVAYNSNFGINHGTMSQHTAHGFGPGGDLFSILNPIQDASHTRNLKLSPPHWKCLPGTRKAVLSDIRAWANGNLHPSESHIMWLYGYAGCGKSALAQEIAVQFDDEGLLAASFFFFRGTGDRGAVVRFACTIASQIAASIPGTDAVIEAAVRKNPGLLSTNTASPTLQFKQLVCHPIKAVAHLLSKPVLIVLDGVDECGDRDEMASLIEDMIVFFDIHHSTPLRILIASRVEDHLHQQLNSSNQVRLLDLVDRTSDADIETALNIEIEKKKRSRVLECDKSWPSRYDKQRLVDHIGGSFIFMTTIIKLLFDPKLMDGRTPMERLPLILSTEPDFDDLYRSILEPSRDLPHFGDIVSTIVLARRALSIAEIAEILEVKAADVANVLVNLHAIMYIPGDDQIPVTLCHTSLRDFLTSEDRSGPFFASPTHHIRIACSCISLAVDSSPSAYPPVYAIDHLEQFLASSEETTDPFNGALAGLEEILGMPIFRGPGSSFIHWPPEYPDRHPALGVACERRNWKLVRALVTAKVDINDSPKAIMARPPIFACAEGLVELVARLLGYGANPNLRGGYFGSALQAACSEGNLEIANLLLEHGADTNLTDKDGFTPLHLACSSWPVASANMVQFLLDSGADPLIRDSCGKTALQTALEGSGKECNVVKMLRRRGVVG